MKTKLPLRGNLVNCKEIRSIKFNLRIMGGEYAEKVISEEKDNKQSKLFGFSVSENNGEYVLSNGNTKFQLIGDNYLLGAFYIGLRKISRGELNCQGCVLQCLLKNALCSLVA